MTADLPISAECRCGATGYEMAAPPFWTSYCHCVDCRRATGAPVAAFAGFKDSVFRRLGREPSVWSPKTSIYRLFCDICGTPIAYRDDRLIGETYFYVGIFARPEELAPARHAFEGRRLPWLALDDDLPRHDGFSVQRPTTDV